jgi:hypothetical protein
MSAKQSLDYSNWVRQEIANQSSPNRGKTLQPYCEVVNVNRMVTSLRPCHTLQTK